MNKMQKIKRVGTVMLLLGMLTMTWAYPVDAAVSGAYGYPQMTGTYTMTGRANARGINSSVSARYTQLDVVISTVVNGATKVTGAIAGNASVLTDETAAAIESTGGDMTLLPTVPAANDTYYFVAPVPYNGIRVDIGTPGVGTWTIVWEYWNGTAWTAHGNVTDGTTGFTAETGNRDVVWADWPSTWQTKAIAFTGGTVTGYATRARVSEYTAITTPPTGDQAWFLCDNVLAGTVGVNGVAASVSEAYGYVGCGRYPNFVLQVKDTEDVTGLFAEIIGTVQWNGTTVSRLTANAYGHTRVENNTPVYWMGTFRGTPASP